MEHTASSGKKPVIVIPTFNEFETIQKIIKTIFMIVPHAIVVIVDDNSPDQTGKIILELKKKYKNLHLVERKEKSGRGTAVIEGFSYALAHTQAQIFIEMDADFSHDPHELPQFIKKVSNDIFVIGSRYSKNSKIYGWPLHRWILSYSANRLLRLSVKFPVHDYTNGYRAYSRKAAELLVKHTYKSSGFILLSESILLLYKNGFTSVEIPTIFVNRREGTSKANFEEFISSLRSVFPIYFKR